MLQSLLQHTAENVPKGIIPLENVRIRAVDERNGENISFFICNHCEMYFYIKYYEIEEQDP